MSVIVCDVCGRKNGHGRHRLAQTKRKRRIYIMSVDVCDVCGKKQLDIL